MTVLVAVVVGLVLWNAVLTFVIWRRRGAAVQAMAADDGPATGHGFPKKRGDMAILPLEEAPRGPQPIRRTPPVSPAAMAPPIAESAHPEPMPAPARSVYPPAPPPPASAADSDLLAEFNALADDFSFAASDAFQARWHPRGVRFGDGGTPDWDESGPLWFVGTGMGDGVVLPSAEVARNWSKFYRSLDGAQAKRDLGAAFDFETGLVLSIRRPTRARVQGDQIGDIQRGLLSGI